MHGIDYQENEDMAALVKACRIRSEAVTHFEPYGKGYYALLRGGARLDIARVETFQPPIADFNDYFGYMFIQTQFSFFILRQRIYENRPQPWELHLEIEPHEPAHFFRRACRRAGQILALAPESTDF